MANLDNLRHSTSHLLAAAVTSLWPKAKPTLGPPISEGFYYDFADLSISEENLPEIEKAMAEMVKGWHSFEKIEVSPAEAKKTFKDNPFKIELIEEFAEEGQKITFYESGKFLDLCRGGHIENPSKEIKYFKLLSVAGAYWRGNEKNPMLTRIYGTIFPTQKELEEYLANLEEAKKRDHRKIGKELELFTVSEEVGPGLVLWLPKGNIIKEEIETWAKATEKEWGYQRVTTPNITKGGLYHTSGHLPYYKDVMYPPMKLEGGEEYYLKPMNCPHHHMIFKSKIRSYKELPLRLAEYGTCYRYEASGELFGMMRVRGFAQNDAHIYCTEEQAVEEFVSVMKLHEYFYKKLGIDHYHLILSLRDPKDKKKYHGDNTMWKKAEDLMRVAVAKLDIPVVEDVGSAAFYGPKIDFVIHSSIGREFGISTNQIDLYMGQRFGLTYVDDKGKQQTPVIIHRAPLGSHERFIGFLIEHWAGAFPTWLSPVQVKVLPITERNLKYAIDVARKLEQESIRVEVDERNETLQAKIRDAQVQKVPHMLIVGDIEKKESTVAERGRSGKDYGPQQLEEFMRHIKKEITEKSLD
jgi:threonyl-tRNA synthetase